eukprot:1851411-Karenia_brevis.AAC.1
MQHLPSTAVGSFTHLGAELPLQQRARDQLSRKHAQRRLAPLRHSRHMCGCPPRSGRGPQALLPISPCTSCRCY